MSVFVFILTSMSIPMFNSHHIDLQISSTAQYLEYIHRVFDLVIILHNSCVERVVRDLHAAERSGECIWRGTHYYYNASDSSTVAKWYFVQYKRIHDFA